MSEFESIHKREVLPDLATTFGDRLRVRYQGRAANAPVVWLRTVDIGDERMELRDHGRDGRRQVTTRSVLLCVDPSASAWCGAKESDLQSNGKLWIDDTEYAVETLAGGSGRLELVVVRTGVNTKSRQGYDQGARR